MTAQPMRVGGPTRVGKRGSGKIAKKIKEIKSIFYTIPAHFLPFIMSKEYV